MTKLTEAEKKQIRALYRHHSQPQLAKMFKVSQATINKVLRPKPEVKNG